MAEEEDLVIQLAKQKQQAQEIISRGQVQGRFGVSLLRTQQQRQQLTQAQQILPQLQTINIQQAQQEQTTTSPINNLVLALKSSNPSNLSRIDLIKYNTIKNNNINLTALNRRDVLAKLQKAGISSSESEILVSQFEPQFRVYGTKSPGLIPQQARVEAAKKAGLSPFTRLENIPENFAKYGFSFKDEMGKVYTGTENFIRGLEERAVQPQKQEYERLEKVLPTVGYYNEATGEIKTSIPAYGEEGFRLGFTKVYLDPKTNKPIEDISKYIKENNIPVNQPEDLSNLSSTAQMVAQINLTSEPKDLSQIKQEKAIQTARFIPSFGFYEGANILNDELKRLTTIEKQVKISLPYQTKGTSFYDKEKGFYATTNTLNYKYSLDLSRVINFLQKPLPSREKLTDYFTKENEYMLEPGASVKYVKTTPELIKKAELFGEKVLYKPQNIADEFLIPKTYGGAILDIATFNYLKSLKIKLPSFESLITSGELKLMELSSSLAEKPLVTIPNIFFSKQITEQQSRILEEVLPGESIAAQIGRGAAYFYSAPYTGLAYGKEIATGLLTSPIITGKGFLDYTLKRPFEVGTMVALGGYREYKSNRGYLLEKDPLSQILKSPEETKIFKDITVGESPYDIQEFFKTPKGQDVYNFFMKEKTVLSPQETIQLKNLLSAQLRLYELEKKYGVTPDYKISEEILNKEVSKQQLDVLLNLPKDSTVGGSLARLSSSKTLAGIKSLLEKGKITPEQAKEYGFAGDIDIALKKYVSSLKEQKISSDMSAGEIKSILELSGREEARNLINKETLLKLEKEIKNRGGVINLEEFENLSEFQKKTLTSPIPFTQLKGSFLRKFFDVALSDKTDIILGYGADGKVVIKEVRKEGLYSEEYTKALKEGGTFDVSGKDIDTASKGLLRFKIAKYLESKRVSSEFPNLEQVYFKFRTTTKGYPESDSAILGGFKMEVFDKTTGKNKEIFFGEGKATKITTSEPSVEPLFKFYSEELPPLKEKSIPEIYAELVTREAGMDINLKSTKETTAQKAPLKEGFFSLDLLRIIDPLTKEAVRDLGLARGIQALKEKFIYQKLPGKGLTFFSTEGDYLGKAVKLSSYIDDLADRIIKTEVIEDVYKAGKKYTNEMKDIELKGGDKMGGLIKSGETLPIEAEGARAYINQEVLRLAKEDKEILSITSNVAKRSQLLKQPEPSKVIKEGKEELVYPESIKIAESYLKKDYPSIYKEKPVKIEYEGKEIQVQSTLGRGISGALAYISREIFPKMEDAGKDYFRMAFEQEGRFNALKEVILKDENIGRRERAIAKLNIAIKQQMAGEGTILAQDISFRKEYVKSKLSLSKEKEFVEYELKDLTSPDKIDKFEFDTAITKEQAKEKLQKFIEKRVPSALSKDILKKSGTYFEDVTKQNKFVTSTDLNKVLGIVEKDILGAREKGRAGVSETLKKPYTPKEEYILQKYAPNYSKYTGYNVYESYYPKGYYDYKKLQYYAYAPYEKYTGYVPYESKIQYQPYKPKLDYQPYETKDYIPYEPTPYIPDIPYKPEIINKPIIFPKSEEKKSKQLITNQQGFNVYVKEATLKGQQKQLIKVNKQPLTLSTAKDEGAYLTDTSLAKTFAVRPTKGKPSNTANLNVPKGYYEATQDKFRQFKVKKGTKINTPMTFIERKTFGLDTPQEVQKITLAKRVTQIRKDKGQQMQDYALSL